MHKAEDWDALYYAIVRINANNSISVIGIGSTKMLCRKSVMDYRYNQNMPINETYMHMIEHLDINRATKFMFGQSDYAMVYAEAKIYIYGKRYGLNEMLAVYDPTYREDLVRFAGYKKKPKGVE